MKESLTLRVNSPEKVDEIFTPGNLVIGVAAGNINSELFLYGITTPRNAGLSRSDYPDIICTTMLGTRPMPSRYLDAPHNGPIGWVHASEGDRELGTVKIGIIVSLTEILNRFPGQVYAVGERFNNDSWWRHLLNKYHHRFPDYSLHGQFVSKIPVVKINEYTRPQEVRIYPNDPEKAYIPSQMWAGIVTNSTGSLLNFLENNSLDVPLFRDDALDTPMNLINLG